MQNKLLHLISSPSIKLYSSKERKSLACVVDAEKIYQKLLPAIAAGGEKHVEQRAEAIKKRAGKSTLTNQIVINKMVEALFDSHFRKQKNKGPTKIEVADKLTQSYLNNSDINLVGLMFTRKNICPLRRGDGDESATDLAEIVSLAHLNNFVALLSKFYPFRSKFTILSEGKLLAKTFDYISEKSTNYQNNLRNWISLLDLKYLKIYDYYDLLQQQLSANELKLLQANYGEVLAKYQKLLLPMFDPSDMDKTINKTLINGTKSDKHNVENFFIPVWQSILNSLPYQFLEEYAICQGEDYDHTYLNMMRKIMFPINNKKEESFRQQILEKSWKAAIEYITQKAIINSNEYSPNKLISGVNFLTTINPKIGSQLGILSIRQTTSCVQPWHGTGFLYLDRSKRFTATALSKLELESNLAVPVYIDKVEGQPFCYSTAEAINKLFDSNQITFNMATRM
jgi:hypothetical protein